MTSTPFHRINGTYRDADGRLRDDKTKRYVKDGGGKGEEGPKPKPKAGDGDKPGNRPEGGSAPAATGGGTKGKPVKGKTGGKAGSSRPPDVYNFIHPGTIEDAFKEFESGAKATGKPKESAPDEPMTPERKRKAVWDALEKLGSGSPEETIPGLRDDLEQFGGTNDVTLIKGDYREGLEHIVQRHGKWVVLGVMDALVEGKDVKPQKEAGTDVIRRVRIEKDGFAAVLSLDRNGEKKTWLLTGLDLPGTREKLGVETRKKRRRAHSGENGKVSARHVSTRPEPTSSRPWTGAEHALPESINQSRQQRKDVRGNAAPWRVTIRIPAGMRVVVNIKNVA